MKLLNSQRFKFIETKRLKNYLLYAIGEIILVVIGILIAVSINNANQSKKENQLLNQYLINYKNDLKIDSLVIDNYIKVLDEKKKAFDLALSDSLNKTNLMTNPLVFNLGTTYDPFRLQKKGFNQLQAHIDNSKSSVDSLVTSIIANHNRFHDLFEATTTRISNDIDDNLSYFKNNKKWMKDILSNKISPEVIDYFLSEDYKNRIALHKTYLLNNLYPFFKSYQKYMEEIREPLDDRLKSINN